MSLATQTDSLAARIAQEFNALRSELSELRAQVDMYHPPAVGPFSSTFDSSAFEV